MAVLMAVPYVSQFASADLVPAFFDDSVTVDQDPAWAVSGAKDPVHYAFWAWRMCGMACLKMVLQSRGIASPPLVPMAEDCARNGGYVVHPDRVDGLIYAPFTEWIARTFGVAAEVRPSLDVEGVAEALVGGQPVMVSVHPGIRVPDSQPPARGGHLVLAVGSDDDTVVFHNPSGLPGRSQAYAKVSWTDFERFFARRGVVFQG